MPGSMTVSGESVGIGVGGAVGNGCVVAVGIGVGVDDGRALINAACNRARF